jgi:hypothetical protein
VFATILLVPYLVFLLHLSARNIGGPHIFRQTQTAWPVQYWVINGFDITKVGLPIKGVGNENWLLEFPLFQLLAYALVSLLNLSIDISVRVLALIIAVSSVFVLFKISGLRQSLWVFTFILVTANPFFWLWATTGLIDWLALFLGISSGVFLNHASTRSRVFLALVLGTGLMVKFPIAAMGFLLSILLIFFKESLTVKTFFAYLTKTRAPILVALTIGFAWNYYASQLYGVEDPRSIFSATRNQWGWYFGSREQYSDTVINVLTVFYRFLNTSFHPLIFAILALLGILTKVIPFKSMLLIVPGMLYVAAFPNLNLIHDYYQIPLFFSFVGYFVILIIYVFDQLIKSKKKIVMIFGILVISNLYLVGGYGRTMDYNIEINRTMPIKYDCPVNRPLKGVVYITESFDPSFFYKCRYQGIMLNPNWNVDVKTFSGKAKEYQFVYVDNIEDSVTALEFMKAQGMVLTPILENQFYGIDHKQTRANSQ